MRKILFFILKALSKPFLGRRIIKSQFINKIWFKCFQILHPNTINTHGHKIFLDPMDSLGLSIYGAHESFETEIFKKEIKKDYVVLDIGANIGYYTLITAKLVGENGKVFAFEPDPNNFLLLEKNIKINHYNNIFAVKKAVANVSEKCKLYLCNNNRGDHRLYDSHDNRQSITVNTIKLDDYFKTYKRGIDFIKMDIQGAKGGALQGMINLLKENPDLKIITEFWPFGLKRFGSDPKIFLTTFIKYGFKINRIDEKKKNIEAISISELLKTCSINEENYTNLFCVR